MTENLMLQMAVEICCDLSKRSHVEWTWEKASQQWVQERESAVEEQKKQIQVKDPDREWKEQQHIRGSTLKGSREVGE